MKTKNLIFRMGPLSALMALSAVGCQAEDGASIHTVEQAVINGIALEANEFPWTVKLVRNNPDGSVSRCSGSLIAPNWILTAGHCVFYNNNPPGGPEDYVLLAPGQFDVTLGDLDTTAAPGPGEPAAQYPVVTRVIPHDLWEKPVDPNLGSPDSPAINDIALLELDHSVVLNELVQPVRLSTIVPVEDDEIKLSGWGRDQTGNFSVVPRQMSGDVENRELCNDFLTGAFPTIPESSERGMNDDEFCITGRQVDDQPLPISGCFGDSGGPVVVEQTDSCSEQVGVHVWGDQQCQFFTVETTVAAFLPWIRSKVAGLEGDVVYEAEDINHQTGGSHPNAWNIWDNGYIWFNHNFQGGTEEMVVRAAGQEGAGWPLMQVRVNGNVVHTASVDDDEYDNYSFSFPAPTGSARVEIAFVNDYYAPPIDRNLFVDKIALVRQGCPPPPEPSICDEDSAVDLGIDGAVKNVPSNACLRVRDAYPTWWGNNLNMKLQASGASGFPLDFEWQNTCSGGSGTGEFTASWAEPQLPSIDSSCATLIQLEGDGSQNVNVTYYGP